jgi:calmodulin
VLGYIYTSELRYVLTTMGEKMTEEEVNLILQEADPTNSGQIAYNGWLNTILST